MSEILLQKHTNGGVLTFERLDDSSTFVSFQPECECGHPYHVGGCPEIIAGYEYNESCRCDGYEPESDS